jgi:hypothetical protein
MKNISADTLSMISIIIALAAIAISLVKILG